MDSFLHFMLYYSFFPEKMFLKLKLKMTPLLLEIILKLQLGKKSKEEE